MEKALKATPEEMLENHLTRKMEEVLKKNVVVDALVPVKEEVAAEGGNDAVDTTATSSNQKPKGKQKMNLKYHT